MMRDIRAEQKAVHAQNEALLQKVRKASQGSGVIHKRSNEVFDVSTRRRVRFVLAVLVAPVSPRVDDDFEELEESVQKDAFEFLVAGRVEHGGKAAREELD